MHFYGWILAVVIGALMGLGHYRLHRCCAELMSPCAHTRPQDLFEALGFGSLVTGIIGARLAEGDAFTQGRGAHTLLMMTGICFLLSEAAGSPWWKKTVARMQDRMK